jgi:hypothetical protein
MKDPYKTASALAAAPPIPFDAPVTIATLPANLFIFQAGRFQSGRREKGCSSRL